MRLLASRQHLFRIAAFQPEHTPVLTWQQLLLLAPNVSGLDAEAKLVTRVEQKALDIVWQLLQEQDG